MTEEHPTLMISRKSSCNLWGLLWGLGLLGPKSYTLKPKNPFKSHSSPNETIAQAGLSAIGCHYKADDINQTISPKP